MTVGNRYRVTKKIKLHTNPFVVAEIVKTGVLVKETPKCYIFDEFVTRKANVIAIEEVVGSKAKTKWDAETIMEIVIRLAEHYPYSPSVMKTILKVANEMIGE